MDKQTLRGKLEELHAELQQVETLDVNERALLQSLAADVQEVLGKDDDHTEPYGSLGGRLRDSVAQVEASHPRVTMLMRQVIDQLSYMGI